MCDGDFIAKNGWHKTPLLYFRYRVCRQCGHRERTAERVIDKKPAEK